MTRAYYYFFYKLYKFYDAGPSVWLSDWKAGVSISVLEVIFLNTLIWYLNIILKVEIYDVGSVNLTLLGLPPIELLIITTILAFNFFAFLFNSDWKKYAAEFDRLSPKQNKINSRIVGAIILFVFGNLIIAYLLLNKSK